MPPADLMLFPTRVHFAPLGAARLPQLNQKLLDECYAFQDIDTAGQKWSKKNYLFGYTSYGSITDLPQRSPTFARLKVALDRAVKSYARSLEMDLGGGALTLSSCWINIMGQGTHHSFHLHPLSAISGTYYVQTPKNSGNFKLEDPRLGLFMASPPRPPRAKRENQRFVSLTPKPGHVVLFESWLKHEVPANHSTEDRVSISFNYDWV